MSASQWRRAMNSAATAAAPTLAARPAAAPRAAPPPGAGHEAMPSSSWLARAVARIRPRHLVVLAAVVAYPFLASPFFTYQIGAQSLALGLIALSLTFLGGYGGMVSLAQMTVAGVAGYGIAIFGTSSAAAKTVAPSSANGTASHHGQPRLMLTMLLVPKIATR